MKVKLNAGMLIDRDRPTRLGVDVPGNLAKSPRAGA